MVDVEGSKPGSFVDYVLPDYGDPFDYTEDFEGIARENVGMFSIKLPDAQWDLEENLRKLRKEGHKTNMVCGLRGEGAQQTETLEVLVKELFDDELVIKGEPYETEWSHLSDEDHKNWSDK